MHPLIPIHIVAGSIALASGFAAMALRKGGVHHARLGTVFFVSMLAMGGTGAVTAFAMPERGTGVIGLFTCYLVATAWWTARRRDAEAGRVELLGLAFALSCLAAFLAIGLIGLGRPEGRVDELPAPVHFPFALLAALAATGDLKFLLRRRLRPQQRIARHLWRMAAALLIAALSFFLGQQKVMPEFVRGSPLLFVPPLLVFAGLLYWGVRVRFAKTWRRFTPRRRRGEAIAAPAEAAG